MQSIVTIVRWYNIGTLNNGSAFISLIYPLLLLGEAIWWYIPYSDTGIVIAGQSIFYDEVNAQFEMVELTDILASSTAVKLHAFLIEFSFLVNDWKLKEQ